MKKKTSSPQQRPSTVRKFAGGKMKQKEIFTREVDLASLIHSATRNIGGRYGLFSELAINSDDWGAENIWITVKGDKDNLEVIVLDDGIGMGPQGRNTFVGVAKSLARLDAKKRGRHGLGTKRMMAEFKHCEVIDISAEENDGLMRIFTFSWDNWLKWIQGDPNITLSAQAVPRDPQAVGLPAGSTGVRIRLWGPRDRYYTAKQIIKHLGDHLAPWVAKKVRVSDDGRQWHPLKTRELIGEELTIEENHPTLGRIYTLLYIPRKKSEMDTFRIGAKGPVCEFSEFKHELPERLFQKIPSVFHNPDVCGIIDVEKFNEYSDNSRQSFDVSLFETDLMEDFINFLIFTLADPVEEALGEVRDEKETERHQRVFEAVTEYAKGLGRRSPSRFPRHIGLILSLKEIELLPNESVEIAVRRHPESMQEFFWEATGGSLNTSTGRKVVYTAGKNIGEYTIRCYDPHDNENNATVVVSIVKERLLRVIPRRAILEIGETIILKAVNIEETSGGENLIWKTDDPEGRCSPSRGSVTHYTAGLRPGTYEILVRDRYAPDISASMLATVVKEKPKPRVDRDDNDSIMLEGIRYRFVSKNLSNSPTLTHIVGSLKTKYVDILVNWLHPVAKRADTEEGFHATVQLLIRQLLLHHIQLTRGEELLTAQRVNELMAQYHAQMLEQLEE